MSRWGYNLLITVAAGTMFFAASCKKNSSKQGASGSTKQVLTEADCKVKTGYQWDGTSCILSTAENNQALCEAAGKSWLNASCVAQSTTTTVPTPTPTPAVVDTCTNATSIAATLSCLDSQYTALDSSIKSVTEQTNWIESIREDFAVITRNYSQIRARNLTEKTNIITKTAACSDIVSMRTQKSQISVRLRVAPNSAGSTAIKTALPEFTKALDLNKSALKCLL